MEGVLDQIFSPSHAPDGDNAPGGLYTVQVSSEVMLKLFQLQQSENAAKTQVAPKGEEPKSPSTPSHTPAKFSPGKTPTNEEIDMLISDTYERMPYSSTHENTILGDTNSKEKTMDASASGDAEKSPVDSAIEGHQDGHKSKQDSPVSVKDTPGEAAPLKRVMGPGNASSTQQGSQMQQKDLPYDVSGTTSSIFVEGATMEDLKKIADKVKDKGITVALKAGQSLRPKIVANGTKYAMSVRLICGEKLSERECLDLTSILISGMLRRT
jgi:hypothetical protein